jgi:copper resistance protein C
MTIRSQYLLLAAAALVSASVAWAHAVLLESQPAINSNVSVDKTDVRLRFNSRVDAERSRLTLVLPDRTSKPLPLQRQSSPDVLTASVSGLKPGDYVIRWQVLASDGHISRGEVPFKVIQPAIGK